MTTSIRGGTPAAVGTVLDRQRPLSGLDGFGGCLEDGRLVRDVLGREPVFRSKTSEEWAFDPRELSAPEPVPPGGVVPVSGGDPRRVLEMPPATPLGERIAERALAQVLSSSLTQLPDVPVAFSGGVDSAVVASASEGPLYVIGFPDSSDRAAAAEAASTLGRPLHTVDLDRSTVEAAVPAVARAIGRTDAMSLGIAIPLFILADTVSDDGYDRLALGQGADELFAGYEKLVTPSTDDRVTADTTLKARGEVLATLPSQVERDVLAIRAGGAEPVFPFLRDRVVRVALTLPESLLVSDERRKVALRNFAARRLPPSIAERGKRALQYGTLVARELDRLARQAGFKRREGDHVSKYVTAQVRVDDGPSMGDWSA